MNHSRDFWRLTDRLTEDAPGAKQWLRQHGASLLRYGEVLSP